jgi:hypothetical protein
LQTTPSPPEHSRTGEQQHSRTVAAQRANKGIAMRPADIRTSLIIIYYYSNFFISTGVSSFDHRICMCLHTGPGTAM